MWDFMFEIVGEDSELCGEQFFVECDTFDEAWKIAVENFGDEDFDYVGKYTPAEAEAIGLDTY